MLFCPYSATTLVKPTKVSAICLACRKKLPCFFTENYYNLIYGYVRIDKIPVRDGFVCKIH